MNNDEEESEEGERNREGRKGTNWYMGWWCIMEQDMTGRANEMTICRF